VVEDGAPTHFKGKSSELRALVDIPNITHPAASPDLNPIEMAWAYVKYHLNKQRPRPTSLDELWTHIEQIWNSIPQETINSWSLVMAGRRDEVEKARGGLIKG